MSSFKSPLSLASSVDGSSSDRMGLSHHPSGEIHVIVGPMFAGKTTALLRRVKSEGNNGRNVAIIKSSKDTRYAVDSVVTHDGTKFPCWALPDLLSFRQKFGDEAYAKLDVIGIDEAQFFGDLYDFCCEVADHDGKTVIVAGLDGDYLRFGAETNALWKQVICNKYKQVGNLWCPESADNLRKSSIWADILGVARTRPELVEFYKNDSAPVLGDGKNTLFWIDKWCGNVCLMEDFPRLYSSSLDKFESVNVMHIRRNSEAEWNLNFRRSLFQWEVEELNRLKVLLINAPAIRENLVDFLKWNADPSGSFTVSSAYKWCDSSFGSVCKVADLIWNNVSPPKTQFFGWLAWKGRIKTSSFLQRIRVLSDVANVNCIFCNVDVESVNHVLLVCPFVWKVWSHILKWWGMQWVQPGTVQSLLEWWAGTNLNKQERVFWKAMPLAVLWSIWKLRNDCIFNGIHPDLEELCEVIKVRVALWSKAAGSSFSGFSVTDIIYNLQQVRFCSRGVG